MIEDNVELRQHYLISQFISISWLILISNIFRNMSFYISLIMTLFIITVCVFWPITAYEVIMGDDFAPIKDPLIKPSVHSGCQIMVGESNVNDTDKSLSNGLLKLLGNRRNYCKSERQCEIEIRNKTDPEEVSSIFSNQIFYSVYMIRDPSNYPEILIRIPFHHTYKLKNLVYQALPFVTYIENYAKSMMTFLNNTIFNVTYGIEEIFNYDGKNEFIKSNPLTQFSIGVVGAHEYLGLTCMIIHMSSSMVSLKEMEMRSLLSIMGMRRVTFISSFTAIYSIILLIFSLYGTIITIIEPTLITVSLRTAYTYVMIAVNYFVVGLLILAQSFLMHTLTKSVRIVTFIVLLVQCLQMIVGMTVLKFYLERSLDLNPTVPVGTDWMNYIFPVIAFLSAHIEICSGSSVATEIANPVPKIIFVFFMAFLTYLVALYLDMILDTGTGQTFPWYFIITNIKRRLRHPEKAKSFENIDPGFLNSYIEPVNQDIVRVRLSEVQMTFDSNQCCESKKILAVRNVSLDLQEGMITAILGHNGAGKTTTFNILVGLLHATGGIIRIYGLDPNNPWDREQLNKMTSICMQNDILFYNMTCLEHMKLFGVIKGLSNNEILKEINALFKKLDLLQQKNKRAQVLSGGEKRKLCVAIALMGDPKIVLFDEPTSGVDPISRRCIWNALKDYKNDRVLILSTHYMDEADILADWKAIMVKGEIVCYGTSMFLKKQFNLGYVFTCTLDSEVTSIEELFAFVSAHAKSSEFQKRYGMEVTFKIANEEIVSLCRFISTANGISALKKINVIDYGISVTKLEEIFLKLGEIEVDEEHTDNFDKILIEKPTPGLMNSRKSKTITTIDEIVPMGTSKRIRCMQSFLIGFYQLWTFIRLNILLSLRSPTFAVLRTVGPIAIIALAAILFWFETGKIKVFEGAGKSFSILTIPLYPYLFYSIPDKDYNNFVPDLECVKRMYGMRFFYANRTNLVRTIKGSTHMRIRNWNSVEGYHIKFVYPSQFVEGFYQVLSMKIIIHNCLLNRLIGNDFKNKFHFFTLVDTWKINWAESGHPSFLMITAFVYMMALSVAFSLMNPVIAGDVVRDRMLGNLDQMTLYGLKYLSYWSAHFILHFIHYILIMCVIIVFMALANNYLFTTPGYAIIFVIIYMLSSVDTILVIYCLSVAFKDIVSAEISFSFSILIPLFLMSVLIFCPINIMNAIHITFVTIFPFLNPWITLMFMDFKTRAERQFLFETFENPYTIPFSKLIEYAPVHNSIIIHIIHIILLTIIFVGYNTYIFVIRPRFEEMALVQLMRKRKDNDRLTNSISATMEGFALHASADLTINKDIIETLIADNEGDESITAILGDLTKIYHTVKSICPRELEATIALSNVNLIVKKGEVFGLLGPSGAGKSTAMNCVAQLLKSSSGKVVIFEQSSKKFISGSEAFSKNMIGLCPQNNPIWPYLTVKEHLLVYAALRGIPRMNRRDHVSNLIKLVHLKKYTDSLAHSLSGGCKRRLSMAISFTGNPDLILLDEPSCGVDPKSRRNLWDTISNAIHNSNKGAIITTQFMEECEALCNRLGILINGRIMCLGSPQELKSKFGRGISVEIKIVPGKSTEDTMNIKMALTQYLLGFYPRLLTVENFGERLTFRIPKSADINFGMVFEVIHEAKNMFEIEDYAVCQPTLEQVYFDFAKYQSKDDLKYEVQIHWK